MVGVGTFLIFMRRSFVALLFLSGPLCAFAASNQNLVYQGRIVRPDGTTPNTGNLTFTLSVYSPSPASCLLYSETQIVSMAGAQGMFNLQLGAGTRTDGGSHTFNDVFVNGKTLSGLTCSSGTTYTGGATEDRNLKVSFDDAGTIVNLSSMAIKSVPFALQAHEVDGWGLNNLVKVSSVGSPTTFTTAEMANAKLLTAPGPCATNEILKWNGSAWGCSADATGGTPADAAYTGTKGIVAFDTDAATSGITVASGIAKLSSTGVMAATYGTASKIPSIAINAQGRITTASEIPISLPSTQITGGSAGVGDVLKWNGSAWLPAADATGTSPGDATYAAKGLVQGNTDAATSGLNLSSGVISVNSGTAANQIVKLDASAKLPSVDGSQLTNLSTSQLSAGTLPVSKGGTGSGTALTNNKVMVSSGGAIVEGNGFGSSKAANTFVTRDASGNFAAGVGTFDSLKINGATSGTLTLTVPASFTNFSLNFPSADGSAGQFLKTDGAGNLSWATSATPGDATYAAKGLVQFNTDAATSGISLSSGVATVNYGTGANQIVKLDAASKLPAVDGSALTNLNANNISSGTLPISRGGTGATTKTSAFDALSPNSAKGDITVHNGTNNISLPRGSDGQVLTTDSAQASGLKWANAATGTVTSVTGGTGLTGGTITSAGTLAVDVGTGANQIVQMTASSKLPAVDGSLLTNLSTSQISSGTLPVLRGGTGASSFTGDSLVGTNTTGTALQSVTCAQNQVVSFDAAGKYGCYNLSSIASGTYFANGGNSFGAPALLGTNDNNTLSFETVGTTRMTLDTVGKVGIGTASPGSTLDVNGVVNAATGFMVAGSPSIVFNSYSLTGATAGQFAIYNNSSNAAAYTSLTGGKNAASHLDLYSTNAVGTTDYIRFFTGNSSERMRIDSSGNVGIGTTSPAALLDITGDAGSNDSLKIYNTSTVDARATIRFRNDRTSTHEYTMGMDPAGGAAKAFGIRDLTAIGSPIRFMIDSSGNVGIGTTNPGAPLDVKGEIRMSGATSGYAGFKSPAAGPSVTWTLPTADGSAGEFLKTDGAGNLSWAAASSSGITSINGSSVNAQSFAVPGTSGTAPAWSTNTGTGVHTLNIPMASTASVTAGLISKTDYDTFNTKLGTSTSFSGDVSGTYNATSVDKIKAAPVSISSLSSGNFLKYNGSAWVNTSLASADITGALGYTPVNRAGDTMSGALNMNGQNITNLGSESFKGTTSGTLTITVPATVTSYTMKWPSAVAASNGQVLSSDTSGNLSWTTVASASNTFVNGGNSFSGAATLGTNDANSLSFETNNTTRMTILSTGNIGVGTTNPGASLEIAKTWSGYDTSVKVGGQELEMDGFSQANAYAEERLAFYKFRGTSASPSVVQNGDVLSSIYSNGYDGTGSVQSSSIRSWVDGTVAAGVVPSRLEFQTMDSSSLATRMTIKNDGKVGINTTGPSSRLEVHEDFAQTAASYYHNTRSSSYVSVPSNSSSTFFGTLVDMYTSGSGSNNLNNVTGQYVDIYHQGTGTLTTGRGMTVNMTNQSTGVITGSSGIMASSINSSTGTIVTAYGVQGTVSNATGQITTSYAGDFQVARTGAGSMTTATGVRSIVSNTGSGTLPTAYGFDTTISSSTGTITDGYGIRIGTIQATNKWALYSTDSGAISYFAGNVGIGKNNPGAPLDVKGEVRMSGATSGYAGFKSPATGPSITWTLPTADGSAGQFLKTDGSGNLSWASASTAAITSLNGLTAATQTFAIGTSGNSPNFSSATATHTLNIPMASTASVTAGLISKTDYDAFNTKLGTSTSFSGDVSGAYNATSVDKIKAAPVSISSLSSGNFLKYNGSAWVNSGIAASDISSGTLPVNRGGTGVASLTANRLLASDGTGSALQTITPCSQYQVLSFDGSGNYGCYNISSLAGFINNGNSFGGTATLGTNDNNNLSFETNNTVRMTIDNTGKIGIGTTPSYKFHMLDDYKASSSNYWSGLIYVSNSPTSASTAYTNALEVDGIYNGTVDSPSAGVTALRGDAQNITTKAVGDVRSLYLETMNTSSGKITNAYGILNEMYNTSTGTIGTAYGAMIDIYNQSTGAITNGYGIYLGANGATNKWSIYSSSTAGDAYFGAWVGIGTASPGSPLEIDASAQPITSTNAMININSTDAQAADKGGMLSFGGQDGSTTRTFANVAGFKENGTSGNYAGYLAFATRANGGSPAERMRIDSSGRIGVGTTSPASGSLFNIASNNGDSKLFLDSYGVSKNPAIVGRMAEGTQAAPTATQAGDDLLYLGGRGYGATGFASISTAGIWFGADENFTDTSQASAIMFETTPTGSVSKTERMRISSGGNVGIGTSNPTYALTVSRPSSSTVIQVNSGTSDATFWGTGYRGVLALRSSAGAANAQIKTIMSDSGSLKIGKTDDAWSTETTQVTIDNNGNVGIGATAPSTLMHILNSSAASTSGQDSLTLGAAMNGGTVGSGARIVFAGTSGIQAAAVRGYTFGASSSGLGFDTGWGALTTKMVITNAGDVGIGTTNPGYKLHVVGTAGLSTGTAWTNASDIRLKDIDGDYEYGLDEILKLHTVRFHYKKDNALNIPSEHPMTGFIAQEVQKVIPDAVHVRDDGYLELNVDPIHWATVNAVQQLHGMCKMTETQMQAIKAKVESHDRRIASVENVNRRLENENEILKKKNEELEKQLARQAKDLELIKKKLGL